MTALLGRLSAGDRAVADRLLALVYDELRELAHRQMAREYPGHTLQTTALAHEAYLRLVDQTRVDWQGRQHFMAIAAQTIRRVLVDHARASAAAKRGGGMRSVAIRVAEETPAPEVAVDVLALDEVLTELEQLDPRQARVVVLRFYGGLSVEEAAAVLDVSERTVKGDWRVARAWLRKRLEE